jgi:FtsP/CotA-like multicopper oxidase with cupredoxin domain
MHSPRPRLDSQHPWLVAVAVVGWLVLTGRAAAQASLQPDGWDANLALPLAADLNADPRIVEVKLEARVARVELGPGQSVEAWTYNGGVPGPLIRARVGDRLIAHFTNNLPSPTTVHWHGLRVPIHMDGVPGISQPAVKPGESFTYDVTLSDAGLFWYHPHVMSAAQVGFGLYGALLVEDPSDGVGVADQLVMVLSDMSIEAGGTLESPDAGGSIGMVFGREGTHVMVNGRTHSTLRARSGAPQRWRIVNAAKSRYFNLDLGGPAFRQIGGDGGLQEFAVEHDMLVLAPGERADVIVTPRAAPGKALTLRSILVNRGFGSVEGRFPFDNLVTVAMTDEPPYRGAPPPEVRRAIEPLPRTGATAVDLELTLAQPADGPPEYRLAGARFSARDKAVRAALGETQVWTVTNSTKWSHPLHLHGFFFQVLDESGFPVRPIAWKDTVNIPFEKTVRFIVRFDERPGSWMVHCHILDHAEGGLMGTVDVGDAHQRHAHPSPLENSP